MRGLCLRQYLRQHRYQLTHNLVHILLRKLALLQAAPLLAPRLRLRTPAGAVSKCADGRLTTILILAVWLAIGRLSEPKASNPLHRRDIEPPAIGLRSLRTKSSRLLRAKLPIVRRVLLQGVIVGHRCSPCDGWSPSARNEGCRSNCHSMYFRTVAKLGHIGRCDGLTSRTLKSKSGRLDGSRVLPFGARCMSLAAYERERLYRSAGGKKVRRRQRCLDRLFPSTLMRGSGFRQCSTSAIVSQRRGNIFCATWFYFFTWSGVPNRRNRHCSLCECIEECIRVIQLNVNRRASAKCRHVLKWPDGCEAAASSHAQRQRRPPQNLRDGAPACQAR